MSPALAGEYLSTTPPRKSWKPFFKFLASLVLGEATAAAAAAAKLRQLGLTLCDPIDGSPPGSPVPGILKARTLEWAAISLSNA